MDFSESTRVVFNRIQTLDPENVTKIIGYLLLHDHGDQEMIRLAFGPDKLIHALVQKAKIDLGLVPKPAGSAPVPSMNPAPISDIPLHFTPYSPASSRPFPSSTNLRVSVPYWDPQLAMEQPSIHNSDFMPFNCYPDSISEDYRLASPNQFFGFEDQIEPVSPGFPNEYYFSDSASSGSRASRRTPSLPEVPVKACLYFNKGFCKHGNNCRFFHGQSLPDSYTQMFSPSSNELFNEDNIFSPGSLEKLELEIVELLKPRRGAPVSIASLPLLYYEKYGKVLQADGYLTESQRHGKAGYNLTKLLARLKNSIRLIDRPHGQHSVILAEDAPRYMEYRSERSDPGPIVSGSRQIYLTFPAESTFTEEDVRSYFNTFGLVEDVRIPCQQKRMFGFVTFACSDTVKMILSKGNPHFVCGARVLVKPYREKSKLVDRKYLEKIESPAYFSDFLEMDSELHSMPRGYETSRLMKRQLMEEHEQALELERRRLSALQLAQKPAANQPNFANSMNELKISEDHSRFPSAQRYNYLLDVLSDGTPSNEKTKNPPDNKSDQESGQGLDLPESPFASQIASSISTVI
ncbi:zinc finger CCCH domain-containing protein 18-like isoform X2 [Malania oleifera]|uniref:zinc finger CCCH domain-containing protein 18-like isoform X2 n=1 Tax=Malania oleifera TaxID=397392 RepID=UPI0025AE563D|nr:zinc finger CCCH domain-containing protein 18-like isoform X2 [Malania oleifera]XP_057966334.1 zinc finger CCCH domain-containing protein 18-like isoform X2 [Malania oleifera]XP_057966343.1 zinc finger CCCH domain-containing protein 18-like isoform X2 [Malania oleifera]